jgi:hypothetical protein
MKTRCLLICTLLLFGSVKSFSQKKKTVQACKAPVFAALKTLPKLEYDCPEGMDDYDEKVLKMPARLKAIRAIERKLAGFTDADWWQAEVDDLNACEIHGKAGPLTVEEKKNLRQGDYQLHLIGNHELRVVMMTDSCYQTGFNGSTAFLLLHKAGKVFVSQLLNGYYSRIDNSLGFDTAHLNGQIIVELSTANSMPPSLIYYYFAVDPKTNKAVPKNIFKEGKKLANQIYSDMLMDEPKDLGLPASAGELKIIRHGRMAPSFSAYEMSAEESGPGVIDANGRKLRRLVYRWNGKFYAAR